MKKCTKCGKEKPFTEFNFKVKSLGTYQFHCKNCTRLYVKNHYNNNRAYYLNKAKERNSIVRNVLMEYIKGYLQNNPCVDCGEKDIVVLEFDHQDRASKTADVSSLVRARSSLESVKVEIEKCQVRCANCHRRKTSQQFNWTKKIMRS